MGLPSHVKSSDPELFLSKRTSRTKTEKSLMEMRSSERIKVGPSLGKGPKALHYYWGYEVLTKGGLLWLYPNDPKSNWKSQVQIFTPNQWTEAADPSVSMREKLKEAEEEGNPVWGQAVSFNLDLLTLSHQSGKIYKLTWCPKHTYSRGLPGLGLVREDAPNPQETGGHRQSLG